MDVQKEVCKYENYINDILKEDLNKVNVQMNKISDELSQYYELKSSIKHLIKLKDKNTNKKPIVKSMMDIGCGFMMEAHVEDLTKIIVNIGLEYYLEFPLPDADKYVEFRCKLLSKQLNFLNEKATKIKAQIKMFLIGIGELQKLN